MADTLCKCGHPKDEHHFIDGEYPACWHPNSRGLFMCGCKEFEPASLAQPDLKNSHDKIVPSMGHEEVK